MSILIIAQLKFKDRERYYRYQAKFAGVFRKFRGRLVVADEHPTVLEGQDGPDKIVVLEFPDEVAALEFHSSAEYQEISVDRKGWRRRACAPMQKPAVRGFEALARDAKANNGPP